MKEVFRSSDAGRVALYQSFIEDAGICSFVRNACTQQSLGGLAMCFFPLPDFWPTLCVMNDEDYPEAMSILRSVRDTAPAVQADWECPRCGESVPGNFTGCWNCENPQGAENER
jgi:Putative prokaryotic signal transducing protein